MSWLYRKCGHKDKQVKATLPDLRVVLAKDTRYKRPILLDRGVELATEMQCTGAIHRGLKVGQAEVKEFITEILRGHEADLAKVKDVIEVILPDLKVN